MENTTIFIEEKEVFIQSTDATKSFEVHQLDIDFIEDDILENEATNGNFDICVDEGVINIDWQIIKFQ